MGEGASSEPRTWKCPECARVASVPEYCKRPICVHAWDANAPEIWDGDETGDGRPIEQAANEQWRTPGPHTWMPMVRVVEQQSGTEGESWQRCPVCQGHGIVPRGFHSYPAGQAFGSTGTAPEQCRRCGGTGTIRAPESPEHQHDDDLRAVLRANGRPETPKELQADFELRREQAVQDWAPYVGHTEDSSPPPHSPTVAAVVELLRGEGHPCAVWAATHIESHPRFKDGTGRAGMTRQEGELLKRVLDCLQTMRGLNPQNPADLKAKLRNHTLLLKSSDHLWHALSHIGYREPDLASDELDAAERLLAPAPVSGTAEGGTER